MTVDEVEEFEMALRAFSVMSTDEKRLVLEQFARLRYPSIIARFFESVHRVISQQQGVDDGTGGS